MQAVNWQLKKGHSCNFRLPPNELRKIPVNWSEVETESLFDGICDPACTSLDPKAFCRVSGHHFPVGLIVKNHEEKSSFFLVMTIVFVPAGRQRFLLHEVQVA